MDTYRKLQAFVVTLVLLLADSAMVLANGSQTKPVKKPVPVPTWRFSCALQLRGEKLEGMYRQAQHISDRFTNTEFGIGIDCGYLRGSRLGLEFGLELASGDIFIIHEDDFLAGSLSAPQVSVKGSLGLTVLSLGRFD